MKAQKYILILAAFLICNASFSQEGRINAANSEYDQFAYIKTSEILLKVANDGYKSVELFQKLGNSFYFNNKMDDAAKWYGELMAMDQIVDAEYYFRYAQALKSQENYDESDKWMIRFNEARPDDLRGKAFLSKVDYLNSIDRMSHDDVDLYNMDLNTEFSDFGSNQFKDQLVFASTRGGGNKYNWNEQPYLDLYSVTKKEDGSYTEAKALNDKINTRFHESSASFTPDDQFMFFTRNNYYKRKFKKGEDGINRLQMFRAIQQSDGTWDDVVPVHFNSDDYSVAHPSVNVYGTKLYFASDMKDSAGASDIFVVDIRPDGSLGEPKNLGFGINTEGHESFPFINEDGDLFFSSNGYPGLGGLDVYVIRDFEEKMETNARDFIIENLGRPFNSAMDDFAYYENLGTKEGFITSNRDGGKGDDDIYSFIVPDCKQLVEGYVKDLDTKEIVPGAIVALYDASNNEIESKVVGDEGYFAFEVGCETEFLIRGVKDTYIGDEKRFTTPKIKQELEIELLLDKDEQEVTIGDDLAKALDIPIIYFDFDKHNIRYDASVELEKVLIVLNTYPTMEIDIRSHTDSRGTSEYNDTLSEKRAGSTRQYLIERNISADRLTSKGYGEKELKNHCSDGVECSEEEHQLNRRSEFIITKMK